MDDNALVEEHVSAFREIIAEHDRVYGYLNWFWENDVQDVLDEGEDLCVRVYFDSTWSVDVTLEAGTWTMEDHLFQIARRTVPAAREFLADGKIDNLLPDIIELS